MTPEISAPTLANWLSVVALGVIWGASFMAVFTALDGYGPLTIAAGRIGLAALALLALCYAMGERLPGLGGSGRLIWVFAIGMGLFSNALPFFLLGWAQQYVASGFAGITMAVVPLFTLVLAHQFVPGELMNSRKAAGFALGLAGIIVLIGPSALAATGGELEHIARLVCILAAASYSTGSIITRRCPPASLVTFSAMALIAASVMIVPAALIFEGVPRVAPDLSTLAVIYLGLGPTALASLLLVQVIRTAGPTFLSQTNYHVPVWSVVFGTVFLSEALPAQILIALGLILAGLALSRARAWRRRP